MIINIRQCNGSSSPAVCRKHSLAVSALDISPDNNHLLSGSHDNKVYLWNLNNLEKEPICFSLESAVISVKFSEDIKKLLL